ncbi:MAG: Nramp family divalent metal transporter [Caldiserica bacterium]|nr:Nramp family divalent metal transporter [Caldisericota bacterium]
MNLRTRIQKSFKDHKPRLQALDLLKYIGPGFLVTVGFIDPGNWASNVAAGSLYGYRLLWMVTLSTLMLILLQHNAAHLGIVTGLCISEAATKFMRPRFARLVLGSAVAASVSTALAEIMGAAIGLNLLFKLPLRIGAIAVSAAVIWLLLSNGYRRIEKLIIAFVSLIGLSFLYELSLVHIPWAEAASGWVTPAMPLGSIPVIMSVLGAVVMPHNLFLHSEIIQSRQLNQKGTDIIEKQLRFEFVDTLNSMVIGWAINSSMIILAAATFFAGRTAVTELGQAQAMLRPMLGPAAAIVFGGALLMAGLSSSVTAGMAGGSIVAGMTGEPYDPSDNHTRLGIIITLLGALAIALVITNPFKGLIVSQIALSIQLPWTIVLQILLTSNPRVMGKYVNTVVDRFLLWTTTLVVSGFNVLLLVDTLRNLLH